MITREHTVEERARRRVTRRLVPFLLLLYFIAFLDRTNVAVAALQMKTELGFTDAIIGSGAGIFFLGYFILEIPGTLIVERWSARKWIARIMVSWGVVASVMGLIGIPAFAFLKPETQFNSLRFILGIAEAGFFPGIVLYLSHWFRYEDRARAKGLFMLGIPGASVISVPLSQWIMHNVSWLGYMGWRWVFILEGLPAIIFGVVTYFYLTDRPAQAKWLPDDEKAWLIENLEQEKSVKKASIREGLLNPTVILLVVIYFFAVTGLYGLTFFLPSIVAKMKGTSVLAQTAISTVPYVLGCIAILLNSAHSDRTQERRWHTTIPLLLAATATGLSVLCADNLALVISCLCLLGIGLHAHLPVFWTHPTSRLTASAAAVSIGLINSIGNLGGYVGPKIVGALKTNSGSFDSGMWFLAGCLLVAGILASTLRPTNHPQNS